MPSILLINGPNLNLLGQRETQHYGNATLAEIESDLTKRAGDLGVGLTAFQSNSEGALIDRVQTSANDGTDAIIINAGALTHTSIGLRDALVAVGLPFFEVHISNVYARERFRRRSLLSDVAAGIVVGCGPLGYGLALTAAVKTLTDN
ncbi:MAG: type II 3-dehydroquinate dehydratase [Pseudomonadota bacterium]